MQSRWTHQKALAEFPTQPFIINHKYVDDKAHIEFEINRLVKEKSNLIRWVIHLDTVISDLREIAKENQCVVEDMSPEAIKANKKLLAELKKEIEHEED